MADDGTRSPGFARSARTIATAWLALLVLMLASLGSAYLKLGSWNMVAGLAIAAVKTAIVAWLFMRLRESGALIRLVAVVGLGVWCILLVLSGVDYETRRVTPAAVQRPLQLSPQASPASGDGSRAPALQCASSPLYDTSPCLGTSSRGSATASSPTS